ncbi:MAG: VWA domain-containing protein [Eubacterium sp.]|nr:VWA domain-containing protein [Eubacterium sp.]
MGIHVWWPLALLALVPIIILLYFLKQNIKKKEFSSIMLWREVYRTVEATKPWEKLRKNLLLILQIITVLLFILALMGPWLAGRGQETELTVLVLDNSASMDTLYDGEKTRLEAAKESACAYVDSLPAGSAVCIVSGNRQAVLVLSGSQNGIEIKNRIQSIEQTPFAGDLSSSLGLVQSCISQKESSQVVFYTDTVFDKGNLEAQVENFCTETENCSLDTLNYSKNDGKFIILAQVTNYGKQDITQEVNLYGTDRQGKEQLLEIADAAVPAGETVSVYFEQDEAALSAMDSLRAELNAPDALAGDNTAWCVLEEEHAMRVLLFSNSNLFVEKAFANLSGVDVYRTSDPGVFATEEASGYDLYIFDGMLPDELPATGNFLFFHCSHEEWFSASGKATETTLKILPGEITSYTADTSFGVNETNTYELPSWGASFLQADDQSAGFYGIYNGHRIAVFGFDLHQTDFGLQAEFPILISELSSYLLDGGLTEKTSYVAGESILVHGMGSGSDLTLRLPDGSVQQIAASEAAGSYLEGTETGVYHVSQEQNGRVKEQAFAVQFPSGQESSVNSAQDMASDQEIQDGQNFAGATELRNLFLVILLILMAAEWVIYAKSS